MNDPKVYCKSCGASKNVMDHQRASDPVGAAKKAIMKWPRCTKNCDIGYLAGIDVSGLIRRLKQERDTLC